MTGRLSVVWDTISPSVKREIGHWSRAKT